MANNNAVKTKGVGLKAEASALLTAEATEKTRAAALELERARRLAHDASASEDENPEPQAPSRLDVILETVADQGKFEVYRQIGGGNKSKVGVYPISEYPDRLETIASTYKGGTFTVIFKDAHGRIRGQDTPTFDATAYSSGSAPSQERGPDVVDRILERMETRDEANRREMALLQAKNSEMMLEMVKLVAQRPAAEAAPQISFVEMFKLVREMTPAPTDPLASLKGTVEMIAMLKDGAADQTPSSPWMVALEKGLELLNPLVLVLAQKASSSGRLERPARLSPGAGADGRRLPPAAGGDPAKDISAKTPLLENALPAPEPIPEPFKEDPQMKEYAGRLLQAALGQVRPSIVAQLVVDAVTPETVDEFEEMVDNEKLLDILIAHEPKLVAHTTWLKSVLTEMQEKFDEAWPSEPEAEVVTTDAPAPVVPVAAAPVPTPAPATPAPVSGVDIDATAVENPPLELKEPSHA